MTASSAGPVKIAVRTFKCSACGGPVTYHALRDVQAAGCSYCGATIDVTNEEYRILARVSERSELMKPLVPLGARGTLRGAQWEVIGFLRRYTTYEGVDYDWSEYLLWNPYEGFRWLSEYNHHFTFIGACPGVADVEGAGHPSAAYGGRTFKSFQHSHSIVRFALGEMTWKVRRGDRVEFHDYIAPPFILSSEREHGEITWSLGEYLAAAEVWEAFKLTPPAPQPEGVFPAQPNPHERPGRAGAWAAACAAAVVAYALLGAASRNEVVHSAAYNFVRGAEAAVLTPEIELAGSGNVEVAFSTTLDNAWTSFDCALVPAEGGDAFQFGSAVEYYRGVEDGEAWSEGSPRDTVTVPAVPAGRYLLRIEPEVDPRITGMSYEVTVKRDVPPVELLLWTLCLLSVWPAMGWLRKSRFEQRRWEESDYGAAAGSGLAAVGQLASNVVAGDDDE